MKTRILSVLVASIYLLPATVWVQAATVEPALASRNWSVNAAHNYTSDPPSAASVQALVNRALGDVNSAYENKVCDFRFADLRRSGNLSLVVSLDGGGTGGCNMTDILDKTPTGFEDYSIFATPDDTLRDSIQDVNHDGNLELVLSGPIQVTGEGAARQECDWPLIFAWNGNGYAEVSEQYKEYYKSYLKDLDKQMANAASNRVPAAQSTMIPMQLSVASQGAAPNGQPTRTLVKVPLPAPPSEPEGSLDADLACERIQAAKTEAFLGIYSDTTMSAAIKDSESRDPRRRMLAAVIFSYIGSSEAKSDLKTLANDADPAVAKAAKNRLSIGLEPIQYYREVTMQPIK